LKSQWIATNAEQRKRKKSKEWIKRTIMLVLDAKIANEIYVGKKMREKLTNDA